MIVRVVVSKWSRTTFSWVVFKTFAEEAKRTPKFIILQGIHKGKRFRHDGTYAGATHGLDMYRYNVIIER